MRSQAKYEGDQSDSAGVSERMLPSSYQERASQQIVTYSPAYTLVPTYECFNRCAYCNFRVDPGADEWLTLSQAEKGLQRSQQQGVIEILMLTGEVHPQSPRRSAWLQRIYDLCQLALDMGFLPHTNAGPLSQTEMAKLKQVNVSMGLMLEQTTSTLLETVHRHAPSKIPDLRLQQLEWAGQLQIPFTTGLLLGIGETESDWQMSLEAIALLQQQWGHIQEVILQPYRPGNRQSWAETGFPVENLVKVVAIARRLLPPEITLQIPPNLVTQVDWLFACLQAGVRDLGGIGPTDEVNPDYPHADIATLRTLLALKNWQLQPRLPVYPQYDGWLSSNLQHRVKVWRDRLTHHIP